MLTNKKLSQKINLLDSLIETYNKSKEKSFRDFSSYESNYLHRIKDAIVFFRELSEKAIKLTKFHKSKIGRPEKLTLLQKVRILLIQRYMQKSNREMSEMLMLFSYLEGIDISYKTIERIYDDKRVYVVLLNMNYLIRNKLDIKRCNVSGDGTGYMLSIKEHYATIAQKLKEKTKENFKTRKKIL